MAITQVVIAVGEHIRINNHQFFDWADVSAGGALTPLVTLQLESLSRQLVAGWPILAVEGWPAFCAGSPADRRQVPQVTHC